MSYDGVLVSAWAKLEGDCEFEYQVFGDEVEFSAGGWANRFEFVATEAGLQKLVEASTEALRELRASQE